MATLALTLGGAEQWAIGSIDRSMACADSPSVESGVGRSLRSMAALTRTLLKSAERSVRSMTALTRSSTGLGL
jgi:hypothetical protein